jgi:glycosyltransferase involved in cell wall biosynthesis
MTAARGSRPRALVIAYDFPPHAAVGTMRTLRVVRQLDARGWQVTVLTGHQDAYRASTPVDSALLDRIPRAVGVIRARALRPLERVQQAMQPRFRRRAQVGKSPQQVRSAPLASGESPRRRSPLVTALARMHDIADALVSIPDQETGWLMPAALRGMIDQVGHARPDVIYSSAPPWTGQLVAAILQQVLRCPWVADFRDPWARAPWREDRYRFAIRGAAVLERLIVHRCDRIVFVASANRDDFAARYGASVAAKFDVVPNGCDPAEFDGLRTPAGERNGPFVLLHAGSLYAGRTPVPLLKAVASALERGLVDRDRFRVRFLGVNAFDRHDLPATCRELGLDHVVEFLPRVAREESLRAMMSASALLLLQPGHSVSVPAKVYEYMAAGRPILAIAEEGEISTLIRRADAGVSVAPADEDGIVNALARLLGLARTHVRPRREYYDGVSGATRIAEILETVADHHGASATLPDVEARLWKGRS